MQTTVFEHIKGEEIPEPWQEKIHAMPGKVYDVTISLREVSKPTKGKWAKVVEKIEKENFLQGQSEEFLKSVKTFKENFTFKDTFIDND